MNISFKNRKLEKVCTDASITEKTYGREMADRIHQRIDQIYASGTIEEMTRFRIGRCHALKQNRKGQFAMDLVHPYRLIFVKAEEKMPMVRIIEIVDYHD